MDQKTDEAAKQKVLDLIKDVDVALLGTREDGVGAMHARPMAFRAGDFDGSLWFFTKKDSRKIREVSSNPETLLCFADPNNQTYVSATGKADIVSDRSKIKDLRTEIYRTWFPDGADDPNIVLLRVKIEHAEYWDMPSSMMVHAYGYIKAVTTGTPPNPERSGPSAFSDRLAANEHDFRASPGSGPSPADALPAVTPERRSQALRMLAERTPGTPIDR